MTMFLPLGGTILSHRNDYNRYRSKQRKVHLLRGMATCRIWGGSCGEDLGGDPPGTPRSPPRIRISASIPPGYPTKRETTLRFTYVLICVNKRYLVLFLQESDSVRRGSSQAAQRLAT
jgi:hypothetical protein